MNSLQVAPQTAGLQAQSFRTTLKYAQFLPDSVVASAKQSVSEQVTLPLALEKDGVMGAIAPLDNQNDNAYFITIAVGTPAQNLLVQIDTGSSVAWTSSAWCVAAKKCNENSGYNQTASSTYTNLTSNAVTNITYGSGSLNGWLSSDKFVWGNYTIAQQTFVLANYEDSVLYNQQQHSNDGLIGLAYQNGLQANTSDPSYHPNIIVQLSKSNQIQEPVFSLWLNGSSTGGSLQSNGGEFVIGGTDVRHYTGDILNYTVSSIAKGYFWSLGLDSVQIMAYDSLTANPKYQSILNIGRDAHAILDSGTTFLTCPSNFFSNTLLPSLSTASGIPGGIGFHFSQNTGLTRFNCSFASSLPPLGFTFSGGPTSLIYQLDWQDYITNDGKDCYLAIQPLDIGVSGSVWILGDVFLRRVYSVYDLRGTIGLAYASNTFLGKGLPGGGVAQVAHVTPHSHGQRECPNALLLLVAFFSLFFVSSVFFS
ncbi:aspartic peptidase domain-containing protein [Chytriomyces sp. MP71]|nr:aspartic peptidase domain-containing protein [Chytriomyces sp. MP71]